MGRNPGKYKTKRGGGRNFSRHLTVNEDGIAVEDANWGRREKQEDDSDEDEDEEEEEKEEESEEEDNDEPKAGPSTSQQSPESSSPPSTSVDPRAASPSAEPSRAQRKAQKKGKKTGNAVAEEDKDLVNPNRLPVKHLSINDASISAPRELSRREREAKEKEEAKQRYWKLHQAGKTDEAKSDLARLKKIREERALAQAARKAEEDAKDAATPKSRW